MPDHATIELLSRIASLLAAVCTQLEGNGQIETGLTSEVRHFEQTLRTQFEAEERRMEREILARQRDRYGW